jgi:uncharacterized protein (AIM24 family)
MAAMSLPSPRMLRLRSGLGAPWWVRKGAVLATQGRPRYSAEALWAGGWRHMLFKMFAGTGPVFLRVDGEAVLFLAYRGRRIWLMDVPSEGVVVGGNHLLAFPSTVRHDARMVRRHAMLFGGGLFETILHGLGQVAVTARDDAATVRIRGGEPVIANPHACVAWTRGLRLSMVARAPGLFAMSSAESLHYRFDGDGHLILQPGDDPAVLPKPGWPATS